MGRNDTGASIVKFRNKYPGFSSGHVTTPKELKEKEHEIKGNFILYRGYNVWNLRHDWLVYCEEVVKENEAYGIPIPDVKLYDFARMVLVYQIGQGRLNPCEVKKSQAYKRAMRVVYYFFKRYYYLDQGQTYYHKHKDHHSVVGHEYYLRHRKRILARSKRNYQMHRASKLEKAQEYYRMHPGKKHSQYIRRRDAMRLSRLVNFTFPW